MVEGIAKITFKYAGLRKILRSAGVLDDLTGRARAVAEVAGEGFETTAVVGKNRARASVITATYDAKREEATDRTLLRAIDAAR